MIWVRFWSRFDDLRIIRSVYQINLRNLSHFRKGMHFIKMIGLTNAAHKLLIKSKQIVAVKKIKIRFHQIIIFCILLLSWILYQKCKYFWKAELLKLIMSQLYCLELSEIYQEYLSFDRSIGKQIHTPGKGQLSCCTTAFALFWASSITHTVFQFRQDVITNPKCLSDIRKAYLKAQRRTRNQRSAYP